MKEILVYADWKGLSTEQLMGILRVEKIKGEEIFSFEYSESWLKSAYAQELDPDLRMYTGQQYLPDEKHNFGLFLDSSPDRWGRMLMERKQALMQRKTDARKNRVEESDYLLGVNDLTRMGALRLKLEKKGEFLANQEGFSIPPFTSIRELEQASLKIESNDFFDEKDAHKWLMLILLPGSSLGGARPKASVVDQEGHLWIAKFPSQNDYKNNGAWEAVVNEMARDLGINVALGEAQIFSQKQHTYLTKRFDRTIKQERIHFSSAMTLLGYKDGYSHKDGGSYLEIVELLELYGSKPTNDIRELWKRIVFSVAVSNTDDHLRNHGFLLNARGWHLSPAFDINPNEHGSGLSLNISEDENALEFDLCMEVIDYFRWKEKDALSFIEKTREVVKQWRSRAMKKEIPRNEIVLMESAFMK